MNKSLFSSLISEVVLDIAWIYMSLTMPSRPGFSPTLQILLFTVHTCHPLACCWYASFKNSVGSQIQVVVRLGVCSQ